jgi:hypothetical protein
VTAQGEDILAWTRNAITERETAARATTERQPYDEWDAVGDDREGETARSCWEVVGVARMRQTPAARDLAQHIALNDPASVLRRCAADRKFLELYEATMAIFGRDSREISLLDRVVQMLAEGYGWAEGER